MSLEFNRSLIHAPKLLFGVEFGATSHQLNGFSQRNAELRPPRCNTAVRHQTELAHSIAAL